MAFPSADLSRLDFSKDASGLLPVIVQDADTRQVLMLGYMNAEALAATQQSGKVTFFSRSRQRLWTKGETSGHFLLLEGPVLADCDGDTLLLRARPQGPVCHTGSDTCWQETNTFPDFLHQLEHIIRRRSQDDPETSYTARLLQRGLPKVVQKVGEEAVETVIEALGPHRDLLLEESADLLFHFLVMLHAKGVELSEVEAVLKQRNVKKTE